MRYQESTLRGYVKTMKNRIKKALDNLSAIHVHFSKGNSKIGKVLNVSTASGLNCGNCTHCLPFCYDIKACLRFPEVMTARAENAALAMYDRDRFFAEIDKKMSNRKKNKYFRWHQGGEILDYEYFCEMVENAKRHSDYECIWTYTKMYWIVNRYVMEHGNSRKTAIPANMVIMFSEWDGLTIDNPYNFPIFTVKLAAGNVNHEESFFEKLWKCPGNCDVCKKYHRGCIANESTYANEH